MAHKLANLFLLAYCLLPVRLPLSVYLLLFLHLLLPVRLRGQIGRAHV